MNRDDEQWGRRFLKVGALVTVLATGLMATSTVNADESPAANDGTTISDQPEQILVLTQADTRPSVGAATINATGMAAAAAAGEDFDEDPFEGFNEKMFWFNREVLDRYLLKPLATGWDFVLPDPVQRGVHNFFDNLAVVRRVVNNGLQLKLTGAAGGLPRRCQGCFRHRAKRRRHGTDLWRLGDGARSILGFAFSPTANDP
ncbi:MAG: VacJ family lipoprotein [Deltaproteobacteria bacterium]|nr:MAG: VacJ family lipoprotein [Deltaproteobacteria bacterium]